MPKDNKLLPIEAKGKRPQFLNTPGLDNAISIISALAGEVSVLHDEVDTLRKILIKKDLIGEKEHINFQQDTEIKKEREEWRELFLENVFRVIEQDVKLMNQKNKQDQ